MRELCIEDIAMSTRVAFPTFLGCRMSDLRRHLAHSPTPNEDLSAQAQVRRNLFGPIDHDENLKFVQEELSKIAQADRKKWNFDFEAEKPLQGRYTWEPVREGVPQAYEMPRLNNLSSNNCGGSTTVVTTTTPHTISNPSSSPPPSSSSSAPNIAALSVPESSTTTTTATLQTINKTSPSSPTIDKPTFKTIQNQPSCSKDSKSSEQIVKVKPCNNNKNSALTLDSKAGRDKIISSVKNSKSRSTQPTIHSLLKIKKPKRAATTKLEDDQPPALVKRTKTSTS